MKRFADNLAAARVIYILTQPFEKSDAFKLGLIDKEGNPLKKPETDKEKDAFDYLHRIVFKLKRLLGKLPGGKSQMASLAAAYMLVKESSGLDRCTDEELVEMVSKTEVTDEQVEIMEDAMAMSTTCGNVANPPGTKLGKVNRRPGRVDDPMLSLNPPPHKPFTFKEFVKSKNK